MRFYCESTNGRKGQLDTDFSFMFTICNFSLKADWYIEIGDSHIENQVPYLKFQKGILKNQIHILDFQI